ncbi:MAG: 1-(5-phosphoribosyl)-5-((5-phosphoribosylamino)methylideneamino)imidazole-4-carboxamide isomerase [Gammaproteobacteria bacterium]|nr:1-(5-phosphoribosyl)-5-((5-phosphoribosylamino)methylideneamino)imidazole-4-carboxamide isomerase [Gammaproteobacteria bacterium]
MLLIPTITLTGMKPAAAGAAASSPTTATAEPLPMAANWIQAGARRLHLADADGKPADVEAIRAFARAHPEVTLQVSGAIRDEPAVEKYVEAGAEYVILDTKAVSTPHLVNDLCLEYPGHILVAMEARSGKVAADGWSKLAQQSAVDAAQHFQREGVAGILYRAADASGARCDFDAALSLAQVLTIPVLVSGGLGSLAAVVKFCSSGATLGGAVLDAAFKAAATDFPKVMQLAGPASALRNKSHSAGVK